MTRLLLVEDEAALARSITLALGDEGYVVDHAPDGQEALWLASSGHHAAIVLDLRLPGMHGREVCRRLRAAGSATPILVLSACDTPSDIVDALDLGADDYVTKPFEFDVLLARLRALLRRGSAGGTAVLRVADLALDTRARRATRGGESLELSALEYRVLEHLARNSSRVCTRSEIAAAIWDDELGPDSNVLEVCISRLRRKLGSQGATPLIHTVRGTGYVLEGRA